jgi:hypothetical protein
MMAASSAAPPPLNLADDGLDLSPRDTAHLLARLADEAGIERDAYGSGAAIAAFEERLAACVGKERAIVMPTGTLANVLALELHATRTARRVVVQQDGHIMGDTGDSAARLAGVTLVPLQDRGAGFSAGALTAAMARAAGGRVATPIAAVVIETPVRSRHAQLFDRGDLDNVVAAAKAAGVRLHLDAARLFIAAAWYGRTPAELCAPFDTVYVSLYKQLGTPFGAALAGPASLIEGLGEARRRTGGGLGAVLARGPARRPLSRRGRGALGPRRPRWRRACGTRWATADASASRAVPTRATLWRSRCPKARTSPRSAPAPRRRRSGCRRRTPARCGSAPTRPGCAAAPTRSPRA